MQNVLDLFVESLKGKYQFKVIFLSDHLID